MPAVQNARHTLGLVLASVGGLGVVIGLGCAIAVVVLAFTGKEPLGPLAVCSLVAAVPSLFLLLRGIAIRRRAIEAGSTLHLTGDAWPADTGHTTHTEAKKPSFLEGESRDETG